MKTYNYYYNRTPISKQQFLYIVPENWETEVDDFGHYSWGYYSAEQLDDEE